MSNSFFGRKRLKILSLDADYFIPNIVDYDWTNDESSMIYFEGIWALRAGNFSIYDENKVAYKEVRFNPELFNGFWERTVKMSPWGISVCESHRDIYTWIVDCIDAKSVSIVNFDQHHDSGYMRKVRDDRKRPVDCGNWALKLRQKGILKDYLVVYPPWKKSNRDEEPPPRWCKTTTVPPPAERYDFVFICRSGAWVPTWCDRDWMKLIEWWKDQLHGILWNHKTSAPFALKERSPNLEEAEVSAAGYKKMINEMRKMNKVEAS